MKSKAPYRTDIPEDPVFIAVDSETTGTDTETAEVVEAAACRVDAEHRISQFFRPCQPIPPEAMAVHHITDEMVAGKPFYAPGWLSVAALYLDAPLERVVFVAHNAAFDAPILDPDRAFPWVCTYRLAKHIFPDSRSFGLQALRYANHMAPIIPDGLYPHSALYDAIVARDLFHDVLLPKYKAPEDPRLLQYISEYALSPVRLRGAIPFGKHRGTPWHEVPADYLRWITRQGPSFDQDVALTARAELDDRR